MYSIIPLGINIMTIIRRRPYRIREISAPIKVTINWFAKLNMTAPKRGPAQVLQPPKKAIKRMRRLVLILKVISGWI